MHGYYRPTDTTNVCILTEHLRTKTQNSLCHSFFKIGAKRTCIRSEKNGKLQVITDCCYEIPLLESLQCLLKTEIITEQVSSAYNGSLSYVYLFVGNEFSQSS